MIHQNHDHCSSIVESRRLWVIDISFPFNYNALSFQKKTRMKVTGQESDSFQCWVSNSSQREMGFKKIRDWTKESVALSYSLLWVSSIFTHCILNDTAFHSKVMSWESKTKKNKCPPVQEKFKDRNNGILWCWVILTNENSKFARLQIHLFFFNLSSSWSLIIYSLCSTRTTWKPLIDI
jgi:hypothetical protein